jgi:hypothetical protein
MIWRGTGTRIRRDGSQTSLMPVYFKLSKDWNQILNRQLAIAIKF